MEIKQFIEKHNFYYVNTNITNDNFPPQEVGDLSKAKLITVDKALNSEQVLEKIKGEKCRPANIYELMAWFDKNKGEIKKDNSLVALGSKWTDAVGYRRVPYVSAGSDGDFGFCLGYFGNVWDDDCAFLCFCDTELSTSESHKSLDTERNKRMEMFLWSSLRGNRGAI